MTDEQRERAEFLAAVRAAAGGNGGPAPGGSTYLNPSADVAAKMGQPDAPSSPTSPVPQDEPGVLSRFMAKAAPTVQSALTGAGTMATNAADAASLGLYSKGRNAIAGAIAPEATADTIKAEDAFRNEHQFLSGVGTGVGMLAPMGAPGMLARSGAAGLRAIEGAAPAAVKAGAASLGPAVPAVARGAALGAGIGGGTTLATDVTAGVPLSEALPRAGEAAGAGALFGSGLGAAASGFNAARAGAVDKVAAIRQNELAAGTSGKVREGLRRGEDGINELRTTSKPLDQALRKNAPGGTFVELAEKNLEPLDAQKAKLYEAVNAKAGGIDHGLADKVLDDMLAKAESDGFGASYLNRIKDLKGRLGKTATDAPEAIPQAIGDDVTAQIPRQSMSELASGAPATGPTGAPSAYEKAIKQVDLLERRAVAKEAKAASLPEAARAKQEAAADSARRAADVARADAELLKPAAAPRGVQKVTDADIMSVEDASARGRVIPAEKLRQFMSKQARPVDYNDDVGAQAAQRDVYFALRDKVLSAEVEKHLGAKAADELAQINKQESAWLRVMEKGDQMEGKAFGRSPTPGFDRLERKGVGGITGVAVRAMGDVGRGAIRAGNEAMAKAPAIPTALAQPLNDFAVGRDTKKLTLGLTDYLFGDMPAAPGVAGAAKATGRALAGPPVTGGVRPEAAGSLLQLARSGAPRQEIEDKGRELGIPPETIERIASASARQSGAMP